MSAWKELLRSEQITNDTSCSQTLLDVQITGRFIEEIAVETERERTGTRKLLKRTSWNANRGKVIVRHSVAPIRVSAKRGEDVNEEKSERKQLAKANKRLPQQRTL